ncbi:MAG: phosphate acyltransferase PlsX [Chloroflexi bacterium]|nr:MAG: phosphate acyltransferase PlsX [Chloroflexota bacterium]
MKLALDAMSGDHAPGEIIKGAVKASQENGLEIVLVGRPEIIEAELSKHKAGGLPFDLFPAEEVVGPDEPGALAIKRKPNSSIAVGLRLLKEGKVATFVSAGNTGALVSSAILTLGRKRGISRPALALLLPSLGRPVLFLDVGANSDCKPQWLLDFARMGAVYVQKVFGVSNPRVGLLSNGEEEIKGNSLVRAAHQLLKESELNFIGNVEGHSLFNGLADVVVTDGFTGNMAIKWGEGVVRFFTQLSRQMLGNGPLLGAALEGVERRIFDNTTLGGALLLGVGGCVIKAHGWSNARAIQKALLLAEQVVKQGVVEAIS